MTSGETNGRPLADALGMVIMAFTSYRGVKVYGLVIGFGFGILWGMAVDIAFSVVGYLSPLAFRALKRLVLEMAGSLLVLCQGASM